MSGAEWGGARRLRYLIALGVIALLAGVFLERAARLTEVNERVAAEQSLVMINTLLTQVVVAHAVRGRLNELYAYADTNPMRLVEASGGTLPANYAGELSPVQAQQPPRGAWVFDPASHELVYRFASRAAEWRARLRVVYHDADADQSFDPRTDCVTGLFLRRAAPERMF